MLESNPNLDHERAAAAGAAGAAPSAASQPGLGSAAGVEAGALTGDALDRSLVAAFRGGDRGALEQLYYRHAEKIWRYARYYSGREEVAAEIVQETFLRVIKYLGRFEGRSKFSTWLYTLARSAAVTEMTRKRDKGMQSLSDVGAGEAAAATQPETQDPAAKAELVETRRAVREAVARLPEPEREALVLFEIEGLSMAEAGEVLGWSVAKMKVTVFRARRRLRDDLLKKE